MKRVQKWKRGKTFEKKRHHRHKSGEQRAQLYRVVGEKDERRGGDRV